MANWVIRPAGEDELTLLVVGKFSPVKIRGIADLALTEWSVTALETAPWVDHT